MKELEDIKSVARDDKSKVIGGDFSGEWKPSVHALKVGQGNFSDCQNIRIMKSNVNVMRGYTVINTTPILTYIKGRSGYHFRLVLPNNSFKSYIITQQIRDDGLASRLYINNTNPPGVGDFVGTHIWLEAGGFGQGYFTEAPGNQLIYANGKETLIYGGDECAIAGFLRVDSISDLTPVNPINYTNQILSASSEQFYRVTIGAGQSYLVGSSRPIQAIKPYIYTANGTTSTVSIKEWNGSAWSNASSLVDGTSSGGVSHAQNGVITFDSTVATSKPAYICDQLIYWYLVTISAGDCVLYHVTVDTPIQPLQDLWDGTHRACIQCQVWRTDHYEDYTGEVYDTSSFVNPIAAKFSALKNTDHVKLMFNEQICAMKLTFIAALVNKVAATATLKYWNGSAYASVGTIYDGTLNVTKTMGQSGVISWQAPSLLDEVRKNEFGILGYSYELTFSATLTADTGTPITAGCYVDTIFGIPTPQQMKAYKFAFQYKDRVFLCGDLNNKEGHIIDFGPAGLADCYNGLESSANGRRLVIGKASSDLMGAVNVFNRFGSSMYNTELLLKPTETHILNGDSVEGDSAFKIDQLSQNIGLAAPKTLTTAETAFELNRDAIRNIALWISSTGPVIFDAAILMPVPGIECYFDPDDSRHVNFNALVNAHSWFDVNTFMWNVCLPIGVGQLECNLWLQYNLMTRKWYKIDTGIQPVPQNSFKVTDEYGNTYYYALLSNGQMVRLENGFLWNGTDVIEGFVLTDAMLPTNSIYEKTSLVLLKYMIEASSIIEITYNLSDGEISGQRIDTGDLRVYDELIEDPAATMGQFIGDTFVCKELIEGASLGPGIFWQDVAGVVSIIGDLIEGLITEITTVLGDFVTAGFMPGLLVSTSGPNNPGPFLCSDVSANKLEFSTARVYTNFAPGALILTTSFVRVEHIDELTGVASTIPFTDIEQQDNYSLFTARCNKTARAHQLKFYFFSNASGDNIKPLAWSAHFITEHTEQL